MNWPQVVGWLLGQGLRIIAVLLLAGLANVGMRRVVPRVIATVVVKGAGGEVEAAKRADTVGHVIAGAISVVVWVVAALIVLAELEIDIAPLLAGAGVVGIAVGFGAQSLIKDLLAGFFILLENQYTKGDVVRIAGIAGLVEDLNLRRTLLRDLDGAVHSIPNGLITTVSNLTREWSRVHLNISVTYDSDIEKVREVINRVGTELAADDEFGPFILEKPHFLRVDNFADSGIEVKILGVTQPIKQWDVMGELRRRLKKAFDEEGIEFAFPHRVIIHKNP